MPTVVISISDPLQDWVEDQARDGQFASSGDFIRTLIEREQAKALAVAELQALVDEGLASGISDRSQQEILEMARRRVASRR